ncbi:UAA transporter [Eremomyces bilateralis CBS 781.70]|uniref:UDP-galactose transporter homolog 1 n=1 Tax=Eremomyces bilateralis CBS 781.70 TaxID=1392243 RepID=A0A6G1GE91_9PEZI|nr:UAA transporter [Eremomyces bilateralis CBS 781.70]KAF1816425.1 UAA transporter [Eremomyces bilateralis CBS 781.70]
MARQKPKTPLRREPSDLYNQTYGKIHHDASNGHTVRPATPVEKKSIQRAEPTEESSSPGLTELVICVGGIYGAFLTWALLQERITTKSYGPSDKPERFQYSILLLTIQALFAAIAGKLYFNITSSRSSRPAIFPRASILPPLALVSLTSSLAAPFGYASLNYIDYITFILAKSCKLLPVMALHVTFFRRRYPLYKYLVVFAVTAGVAVFTVHHPSTAAKAAKRSAAQKDVEMPSFVPEGLVSWFTASTGIGGAAAWGLLLLSINLLFDGITNSTQDHIFTAHAPYSGPQMMVAQNTIASLINVAYLALAPTISRTPVGAYLGLSSVAANELWDGLAFLQRHPEARLDVLGFAICGAVGQVFIFRTLSRFSSLLLVTVTVTRKMLTMVLSVIWFGHKISGMQWFGVGLVFGGVGAEAVIQKREKSKKAMEKKKREKSQ